MGKKVLIVDDSLLIRKMEKKVFSSKGVDTVEASDGNQAYDALEKQYQEIGLVITDLNMPGMNGYELLKAIKNEIHFQDIPVVIATTESGKAIVNQSLMEGAADFIIKPFKTQDLLKLLQKYIGEA